MHIIKRSAAIAAAIAAVLGASPAMAECQFAKLGELAVDVSRGPPTIDIAVGGKTAKLLIDTGSTVTFLTGPGAAMLGIAGDTSPPVRVARPSGEVTARQRALTNVTLGQKFLMNRLELIIIDQTGEQKGDIVGSLGLDVLAASDVEFDLGHGRIAFFRAMDCAKQPLAYWSQTFSVAESRKPEANRPQLMARVELNGRPILAQLTTTAPYSLVDRGSAQMAGVGPDTAGVVKAGTINFGGPRDAWIGAFESFKIGEEQIGKPRLTFAHLWNDMRFEVTGSRLGMKANDLPSMILGVDFLRSHRVLFASSQGQMYFTYNGGPVFARPGGL